MFTTNHVFCEASILNSFNLIKNVYTCMYMCVGVCLCIYTYACVYTYIHVYVYIFSSAL